MLETLTRGSKEQESKLIKKKGSKKTGERKEENISVSTRRYEKRTQQEKVIHNRNSYFTEYLQVYSTVAKFSVVINFSDSQAKICLWISYFFYSDCDNGIIIRMIHNTQIPQSQHS